MRMGRTPTPLLSRTGPEALDQRTQFLDGRLFQNSFRINTRTRLILETLGKNPRTGLTDLPSKEFRLNPENPACSLPPAQEEQVFPVGSDHGVDLSILRVDR